jgi:type II restriction/modification system DNA methylase subunit YeeA
MYWFEKAHKAIVCGDAMRAGLVGTNSIRGGPSRAVLENIVRDIGISDAWSDEPWINEGAAVRVSLVCFGESDHHELNGQSAHLIFPDLTADVAGEKKADLTKTRRLPENQSRSFMGVTKSGPFDLDGEAARKMLIMPNPSGRPNTDVLSPSINGADLAGRQSGEWILNFGTMSEVEAAHYELPWEYALEHIKAARQKSRTAKNRSLWWRFERPRPELFGALVPLTRYVATPLVSKHRFFVWVHTKVLPENVVIVIARDDDVTFGVLQARMHELWTLRLCSWLGVGNDPRYTPTTTFETFPFPEGLTPDLPPVAYTNPHAGEIATAAKDLNELRERWLNPPEWADRVPEVVSGYPDRIIAKPGHEADLKRRTLTNLYNARPTWLDNAHKALDAAVAKAYGWTDYTADMADEEILRRLLALNQQRAASSPAVVAAGTAIPADVK